MTHYRSSGAPIDDEQVDSAREPADPQSAELSGACEGNRRAIHPSHLRTVDTLFGRPESCTGRATNLDEYQFNRRARIHRQQVYLVPAHADVPRKDSPAESGETRSGLSLRQRPAVLSFGRHGGTLSTATYRAVNTCSVTSLSALVQMLRKPTPS